MKLKGKQLFATAMSLAICAVSLPFAASAEATYPETGNINPTTKTYTFDTAADLNDFDAYWWASGDNGGVQQKVAPTDIFQITEDKVLSRIAGTYDDWNGFTNNVTALTFKDMKFKNFDISFEITNTMDSSYSKRFYVGVREELPGQIAKSMLSWDTGYDSNGKARYDVNITTCGQTFVSNATADFTNEGIVWNEKAVMNEKTAFRIRAVGDTLQLWRGDITGDAQDTAKIAKTDAGYLSLIFANTKGTIDNISITNLDDSGNAIPMPSKGTKYLKWNKNAQTHNKMYQYYDEFVTTVWDAPENYRIYKGINTKGWNFGEWGGLDKTVGVDLNQMAAWKMNSLAIDNPNIANFELEFSVGLSSYQHHGNLLVTMRTPEPGKAYKAHATSGNMYPAMNAHTFITGKDANVSVTDGSISTVVGTKVACSSNNCVHNYKLKLVGNTLYSAVDGVVMDAVELGNLPEKGYVSVIGANIGMSILGLSITALDENGNVTDWPADAAQSEKTYHTADLSEIGTALDANWVLANDIADGSALPRYSNFTGTFDGDGHTIKAMDDSLFVTLSGDAIVKNLVIDGYYQDVWNDWTKGVVAEALADATDAKLMNIAIINSHIAAASGGAFVGGVGGGILTIENCMYQGQISMQYYGNYVGGGAAAKLVIKNSYIYGGGYAASNGHMYACDMENSAVTVENAWIDNNANSGNWDNDAGKRDLADLGFSTEYWVHDGTRPQLKITGAAQYVAGDANSDGVFDIADLIRLKKANANLATATLIPSNMDTSTNVNGEAVLDAGDLTAMAKALIANKTVA